MMNTTAWQEGDQKYADGDAVTFDDTGTGGGGARGDTQFRDIARGRHLSNLDQRLHAQRGTGAISGTIGLTKTGAGSVTLSSANTYTGGTSISGGTSPDPNQNAPGTGAVTVGPGDAGLRARRNERPQQHHLEWRRAFRRHG
ncbi:MAG: autotransporter-associated beta strand repeat-containing protein [Kiritimatiellia bacterium]